jgi:hypothetical protein
MNLEGKWIKVVWWVSAGECACREYYCTKFADPILCVLGYLFFFSRDSIHNKAVDETLIKCSSDVRTIITELFTVFVY